jgi:hypothetical protein
VSRAPVRVITCGALAGHIRDIAARRGWRLEVEPLPARLHNRPEQIPAAVVAAGADAGSIVAYADCGTYGKLDQLIERADGNARGSAPARRLPGLHCYDILAGPDTISDLFHVEPGTYLLTDYLVRTFDRTVVASLGLDRHPELWPDYFGHYTRVTWLAQEPTPELEAEATRIAARFGLPLTKIVTGLNRLEAMLAQCLAGDKNQSPAPPDKEGTPSPLSPPWPGPGTNRPPGEQPTSGRLGDCVPLNPLQTSGGS